MATPNRPPAVGCGANCQVITISEQTTSSCFGLPLIELVSEGRLEIG